MDELGGSCAAVNGRGKTRQATKTLYVAVIAHSEPLVDGDSNAPISNSFNIPFYIPRYPLIGYKAPVGFGRYPVVLTLAIR